MLTPVDAINGVSSIENLGLLPAEAHSEIVARFKSLVPLLSFVHTSRLVQCLSHLRIQDIELVDACAQRFVDSFEDMLAHESYDEQVIVASLLRMLNAHAVVAYRNRQLESYALAHLAKHTAILSARQKELLFGVAARLAVHPQLLAPFQADPLTDGSNPPARPAETDNLPPLPEDVNVKEQIRRTLILATRGTLPKDTTVMTEIIQNNPDECFDGPDLVSALGIFVKTEQTTKPEFETACLRLKKFLRVLSPVRLCVAVHAFGRGKITAAAHPDLWKEACAALVNHKDRFPVFSLIRIFQALWQCGVKDDNLFAEIPTMIASAGPEGTARQYCALLDCVEKLHLDKVDRVIAFKRIVEKVKPVLKNATVDEGLKLLHTASRNNLLDDTFMDSFQDMIQENAANLSVVHLNAISKALFVSRIANKRVFSQLSRIALGLFPKTSASSKVSLLMNLVRGGVGEAYARSMDSDWEEIVKSCDYVALNQILFLLLVEPSPIPPSIKDQPTAALVASRVQQEWESFPCHSFCLCAKALAKLRLYNDELKKKLKAFILDASQQSPEQRGMDATDAQGIIYAAVVNNFHLSEGDSDIVVALKNIARKFPEHRSRLELMMSN